MIRLFVFMTVLSSCHVFIEEKLPARSINFHEQLSDNAYGYWNQMNQYLNTESSLLSSAPPFAFFKQGAFSDYNFNENFLFSFKQKRKDKVRVVCTLDPSRTKQEMFKHIQDCFSKGAVGVKSYHLHGPVKQSYFKNGDPLDDETYHEIFKLLEREKKIFYLLSNSPKEVERILKLSKDYSGLNIYCPNFCFMSNNLARLEGLFKSYPNLLIGYSFIYPKIFFEFLKGQDQKKVKEFFQRYQDRILYETSLILDENEIMSDRYMYWNLKNQYSYLKFKQFSFFSPPIIKKAQNFLGLELSDQIIDKIYYTNAKSLLDSLSNSR